MNWLHAIGRRYDTLPRWGRSLKERLYAIMRRRREGEEFGRDLFSETPKCNPENLFGREKEIENLKEKIRNRKIIAVKGYRMVGKSSVVKTTLNILDRERRYICIYIDLLAINNEEELINALLEGAESTYRNAFGFDKLPSYVRKFNDLLNEGVMKISKTEKKRSITAKMPSIIATNEENVEKEQKLLNLRNIFYEMNKAAMQVRKTLIVVLDEVQNVLKFTRSNSSDSKNLNFTQYFQEVLMYVHNDLLNIRLILTGSHSRLFRIVLAEEYKDPLYGRIDKMDIEPFTEKKAKEYLLEGFRRLNIEFKEEWAEVAAKVLGGTVGWLAYYGRSYKEKSKEAESKSDLYLEVLKKTALEVLKETAEKYEEAIRDDLKTFAKYKAEGIDEDFPLNVLDAVVKYSEEHRIISYKQIREYTDKVGSYGDIEHAIDILREYGIVEKVKEDKVILVNPCIAFNIAFNAGIAPKAARERTNQEERKMRARHLLDVEYCVPICVPIGKYHERRGDRVAETYWLGIPTGKYYEKKGDETIETNIAKITPSGVEKEENIIYIGNKNVMSYVLEVVTQFNNGCEEVVLKARGRAISRAVDTAEVIRNKFMPSVKVKDIRIGTEELQGEQGERISVTSIEIVLRMEK